MLYPVSCTNEQKEIIKILVQHCRTATNETVAEVLIKALTNLKEVQNGISRN